MKLSSSAQSIRTTPALRRLLPSLVVFLFVALLYGWRERMAIRMANEAFATGYALLSLVVFLCLLGIRKRVISHELGRLAVWQRAHHYVGLASLGAYVLHAGIFIQGWLEVALALTFWVVALTGIASWYVNRTAPKLLLAAGGQILRQDIAARKQEVAQRAYELALASAGKADTSVLADHFRNDLQTFFTNNRTIWYRLYPSGTKRRQLLDGLENIDRYLNDEGKLQRAEMSQLVRMRDDLDFQSAIQNRLRLIASAHTWFLGAFMVLTLAHVISAYQFSDHW